VENTLQSSNDFLDEMAAIIAQDVGVVPSNLQLSVDGNCPFCIEESLRRTDNIFARNGRRDNIFARNGRRHLDEGDATGLAIVQIDFSFDDNGTKTTPSNDEIKEAIEQVASAVNAAVEAAGVDGTAFPDGGATSAPTASYSSKSYSSKKSKSYKKKKSSKKNKSYYSKSYYSKSSKKKSAKKYKSYYSKSYYSKSYYSKSYYSTSSDDQSSASPTYYSSKSGKSNKKKKAKKSKSGKKGKSVKKGKRSKSGKKSKRV